MSAQNYDDEYARDRAEIEDLMARYLFALDYNDLDTFIAMFTDDAEFEFARGRIGGQGRHPRGGARASRSASASIYKDEDGNPAVLRHVLAHAAIRVEGDRAWTRAQWFEMANDGPGKSLKMGTFGIYEDKLQQGRRPLAVQRAAHPQRVPAGARERAGQPGPRRWTRRAA